MKLYVIRHGESVTNRAHTWTGWNDVPLSEKGISDAERARALIGDVAFDKIYSSDLIRATKTAEIVVGARKYETTPMLREVNVGSLAGTQIRLDGGSAYRRENVNDYSVFGGESPEEFRARILAFMECVAESGHETVAAFAHAGVLRMMASTVLNTPIPRDRLICGNCAIAVFEYEKEAWRLHSWINLP